MEFKLRGAEKKDIDILFQIHKDAYEFNVAKIWGWDDDLQSNMFRKSVVLENVQVIIIRERPVGYIDIDHRGDFIFIRSIAIISDYRSKGIGGQVIQDIIEISEKQGMPVHLQVMKINEARKLYDRLGFKVYDETETHYKLKREPVVS